MWQLQEEARKYDSWRQLWRKWRNRTKSSYLLKGTVSSLLVQFPSVWSDGQSNTLVQRSFGRTCISLVFQATIVFHSLHFRLTKTSFAIPGTRNSFRINKVLSHLIFWSYMWRICQSLFSRRPVMIFWFKCRKNAINLCHVIIWLFSCHVVY